MDAQACRSNPKSPGKVSLDRSHFVLCCRGPWPWFVCWMSILYCSSSTSDFPLELVQNFVPTSMKKETGLCCTEAMADRRMFVVFSLGFVGLFLKGKFEHGTGRKQTAHSVLTLVLNRLTCLTAAISVRSRGVNERPTFSDTESEEVRGVRSAAQGLGGYGSAVWFRTVARPFKMLQDVLKPCCKTPYL